MKKILVILTVAFLTVTGASAQHEIGGIVGGFNGLSYKYWFNENLALQVDFGAGLTRAYGASFYKGKKMGKSAISLFDATVNPNVLYHFQLPANFKIYIGGGVNIGMTDNLDPKYNNNFFKFGVNSAVGFSYDIQSAPVALALDFRPGYGLAFKNPESAHLSYFDWKIAFAVRYRF